MIDTTELRRLRDAATKGPWVPYEDTDWIHQADDYESQPFIGFAANHAHAIADELDALRKRVAELEAKQKAHDEQRARTAAIALDHITQTGTRKIPRKPVINE